MGLASMQRRILLPLFVLLSHQMLAASAHDSLYEVLGVSSHATILDVKETANALLTKWDPNQSEAPEARARTIQVQHAADVLGSEERRKLYDEFGFDDLKDDAEEALRREAAGLASWPPAQPLWPDFVPETEPSSSFELTEQTFFERMLHSEMAWILQLYSPVSAACQEFAPKWEQLVGELEGMLVMARLNVGEEVELAAKLADTHPDTGKPFFGKGLPVILGKPPLCSHITCLLKYRGRISDRDRISAFAADRVLRIPPIPLVGLHNVMTKFIKNVPKHKVRCLYLMAPGEYTAPAHVRFWAAQFWKYSEWAALPWFEHDAPIWQAWWGVTAAPALAVYQDPALDPYVHHGPVNGTTLLKILQQRKSFVVPQIRTLTVSDIGCDPLGYPRSGRSSATRQTWYCVVAVGIPAPALTETRIRLRRFQDRMQNRTLGLATVVDPDDGSEAVRVENAAVQAWHDQRLTLAWLDGKMQRMYCGFHMGFQANIVCPKSGSDGKDVGLYMTLYQRKGLLPGETPLERAVSFVSVYKGDFEDETGILNWMHLSISQGDDFEFYDNKKVAPPLIPEDKIHWSTTLKAVLALTRDSVVDQAHALAPAMSERVASIPESVRGAMPAGKKIWSPLSYAILAVLLSLRIWMGWRRSGSGQVANHPPAVEAREGDDALLTETRSGDVDGPMAEVLAAGTEVDGMTSGGDSSHKATLRQRGAGATSDDN